MFRDPFTVTKRPPVIGRIITAAITIAYVLIVYDGWASLRLWASWQRGL